MWQSMGTCLRALQVRSRRCHTWPPGGLPSTNLLEFRFPEAFRVLSPAVGARAERPVNLKRWTGRVVIQPARGAETL